MRRRYKTGTCDFYRTFDKARVAPRPWRAEHQALTFWSQVRFRPKRCFHIVPMTTSRFLAGLVHVLLTLATASTVRAPHSLCSSIYTHPVIIWGNNPHWTKVTTVPARAVIRLYSDGAVKFGHCLTTDTAVAGVEGNLFFSGIQKAFQCGERAKSARQSGYASSNSVALGGPKRVNFNQGGV
jgi:hypothetical protein